MPRIVANHRDVIVPSLLSRHESQTPHRAGAGVVVPFRNQDGISYYRSGNSSPDLWAEVTCNRKTILKGDRVTFDGEVFKVNNNKRGLHSRILHRCIRELNAAIDLWGRVFAYRFDLHHKGMFTEDSKMVSKFWKNLKRRIERHYGLLKVGYVWVREMERGKSQHYHCVIYLDGDVIQRPSKLRGLIEQTWEAVTGVRPDNSEPWGHVFHPDDAYYNVPEGRSRAQLIYRLSYFAKTRGKGYRLPSANDFSSSNLGGGK